MKKVFVIFLLLFVTIGMIFAQNQIVNGMVVDNNNNEISDVGIYCENGVIKAISDKHGFFRISVQDHEIVRFTHISHNEKSLAVDFQNLEYDADSVLFMIVVMQERDYQLPEATIVSNTPHLAYYNKDVWVIDYHVSQKGLFLISGNGRSKTNTLLCLSSDQDTIAQRTIPRDFEQFYEDAFGNLHILGNDSTFQVYCNGHDLHLLYGNKKDVFEQKIYPIAASTDSSLVLKYGFYSGQEIVYTALNKNTKARKTIAVSTSDAKEAAENWNLDNARLALVANDEYDPRKANSVINSNAKNGNDNNTARESAVSVLKLANDLYYSDANEVTNRRENMKGDTQKRALFKSVYCPLFLISNYIYIFDFENETLKKFDATMEIVSVCPITFHETTFNKKLVIGNPWKENVVVDKYSGKCYAEFENGGCVTLKEIDLDSGEIVRQITLDKHVFPTNIQIFNGYVYYLFRNMTSVSIDKRSLYKMKIE